MEASKQLVVVFSVVKPPGGGPNDMKCLFWKSLVLTIGLGMMLALGAFSEGSISLPLACALCYGGVQAIRAAWAMEQRAEHSARRPASVRPKARQPVQPAPRSATGSQDPLQAAS